MSEALRYLQITDIGLIGRGIEPRHRTSWWHRSHPSEGRYQPVKETTEFTGNNAVVEFIQDFLDRKDIIDDTTFLLRVEEITESQVPRSATSILSVAL